MILDGANIINRTLIGMGLSNFAHNWLSDPKTALTTVAIVAFWKVLAGDSYFLAA